MKKYSLILFFVIISFPLYAQDKNTKTADKLIEKYKYNQAIDEYLSLVEKGKATPYVYNQLADCYYIINNTEEAEKWYAKVANDSQTAELIYKYAQVLKSNGKYDQSNQQMDRFVMMMPDDQRAVDFKNNPDYLLKIYDAEKLFDVIGMKINSDKADFGAILVGDTLYFASARNTVHGIDEFNNEPFLDIYQSTMESDTIFSDPVLVKDINTKYHEGPVSVTNDGNTIYFSSESFNNKIFQRDFANNLKKGLVHLYKATNENGNWTSIKSLPFNSVDYSTSNPSIDKEGKTLYFSSNMPGSVGGIDIWKVSVNADGTFSTPENLGDKINTVGDESFPFISDDNILYFSSNGLLGLGGYDLFSVDLNKNEAPVNLGKPVNTSKDDFAFSFNKEKNIGFISSNRSGQDDIYNIKPYIKNIFNIWLKDSETGEPVSNARVTILDLSANKMGNILNSDQDGLVVYRVNDGDDYIIEVHKDGYVTKKYQVNDKDRGETVVNISLEALEEVEVTEEEIILNPIYFEFDKSDITKEGAEELDKLVYIMSQNEELVIFAKSHTDSKGSDKYNMRLSEKRAKSTVDYIISKGISKDRISGQGFGESEPKIDCKDKCTDEEDATNRRSEFIIVKEENKVNEEDIVKEEN